MLVIEDNPDDIELVHHELRRALFDFESMCVHQPEAFRQAIEQQDWDVILSDFTMPRFSAPAALEILKESGKDIPFIIVSGSVGEDVAVQAMRAGAQDFFAKTNLTRLPSAITREVREAQNRRERFRVAVQLGQAEERYRLMVENVRDYAIFMLDINGDVASWNHGATRLTGYEATEILGRPFTTLFAEEERAAQRPEEVLRAATMDGSHTNEGRKRRRDGTTFWALCTVDRIADTSPVGYSVVLRDITEKKRLLDGLRQAVRARDEFLSIASHELKTPLTAMELQLGLLKKLREAKPELRLSDEKIGKKLDTIERQAERLTVLINNLLEVTRITSGRIDLKLEEVDLAQIIWTVLGQMRESIDQAGCLVSVYSRGRSVGLWDRPRIEALVANLLSNAIKYGAGKPIALSLESTPSSVLLQVLDHGIGISAEQQARIFERFERAVPEEHYGGFGLGLWIVRQITEAHHGTVRVESQLGEGSTFLVELPLRRQEAS